MPEPNLPTLNLNKIVGFSVNEIRKNMPELPVDTRQSLCSNYGLSLEKAVVLVVSFI